MLTCRNIMEGGSDYVDGQMTSNQRISFRIHLLLCSNCRRFMNNFRTTISYVKALPDQDKLSEEEINEIVQAVIQKKTES